KEDPLLRPWDEAAGLGRGDAEVVVQLSEDVPEGRRRPDAGRDREGQSMRVAGRRIGILAQDQDAGAIWRRQLERKECILGRGQDVMVPALGVDECGELAIPGLASLVGEKLCPAGRN